MQKFGPYLVFFAAMLWATDAPFRVHLVADLPSNFIVLGEHFVSVLFMLPILIFGFSEIKKLTAKEWLAVLFIAVGGSALAAVAFTQSFHYVNPSVAILLQKLQPLLAIGLAAGILKEHLGKRFWIYAGAALFGAYLISFPNFIPQSYAGEAWNPNAVGVLLALVAAALWGASTVFGKFVLNRRSFTVMTSLRFSVAFLFLILLNWYEHTFPPLSQISGTDVLFLIIVALVSGVVSLFVYYKGLSYTKASVATLAELGFPMAAVVVNWIFLKDALVPMQLLGMAILLFAVFRLARYNSTDAAAMVVAHEPT
ncbi:EamA family transporter [Candidatus Kaiserbacteria bacterium]|nr:EamA family transporter [Candidatus Kaiserbacteria bacterium]